MMTPNSQKLGAVGVGKKYGVIMAIVHVEKK